MALERIRQAGGAAIRSFHEKILKPVFGRFKGRPVAQVKPDQSVSARQVHQSGNAPDTKMSRRKSIVHSQSTPPGKRAGAPESKNKVRFSDNLPVHNGKTRTRYSLRNHEQSYLHGLLVNTRPGRVRRFIYMLHLTAPSHPKKEVAEFKAYLKEGAVTLWQLNDIQKFLSGERLADCQIKKAVRERRREIVVSRVSEIIVELMLGHSSNTGEELINELGDLLERHDGVTSKLRSAGLYRILGAEAGISAKHPKTVLKALGIKRIHELSAPVSQCLEKVLAGFHQDPEAAQDIIDTRDPYAFNGNKLADNDWSKINKP